MPVTPAMRIERFVPRTIGADDDLRARLIPDLGARAGLQYVVAGRQGPDDLGPRIIVSVWTPGTVLGGVAVDARRPEPAGSAALQPDGVEDLIVRVAVQPDQVEAGRVDGGPPGAARVLRVFRGAVRTAERDAYVRDVETGTLRDIDAGTGPLALFLAVPAADSDRFVTVSVWPGWSEIEAATGGNPRNPVATRHPERLVASDVAHYEVVEP